MKNKLLVPGLLVLAAAAAGGGLWWWQSDRPDPTAPVPQFATAERGDLVVMVSATGTVEPEYVVEIKSKASGTVAAVLVEAGSQVDKGAPLVEIDPVVERRKVAQAEADLRMAEAQKGNTQSKLDYSRGQLRRDEALLAKGLLAREAVDQLRGQVAVLNGEILVAQAQVLKAKASYDEATDRLTETKIFAPSAGTVLERLVNPGQVIAAGTATGGETLLTLADLSRLFVRVKIDEADVANVQQGQPVTITADALPGQAFAGSVLRVAPQGKVESNVTVFDVVVAITGEGRERLRPMLSANVDIRVGEAKDVVLVPRRALQQQPQGKVEVLVEGRGPVPVEVGLVDDRQAEIRAGLDEGTRVQLPGARRAASKSSTPATSTVPGLNLGGGGGMRMGGGHQR